MSGTVLQYRKQWVVDATVQKGHCTLWMLNTKSDVTLNFSENSVSE
jgi:hypothetical protein